MVPLAALIFRKNPLVPGDREVHRLEPGTRPIDWLMLHHPRGCGGTVRHWHNDEPIAAPTFDEDGVELTPGAPDYLERPAGAGDVITLVVFPAEPVSLTTIIVTALVTAAVSAAVSIGLSLLFPDPTVPTAATPDGGNPASPAYNVRSRQNMARLGEPVPVLYGRVLMTPDLCAQPFRSYEQGTRGMAIDMLMCLGQGEHTVHNVIVGETDSDNIEQSGARYIVVPPGAHGQAFGNLNAIALANGWERGFSENPWTSLEIGEQRFTNAGDQSGFYQLGRAGVSIGSTLTILVEWPRGLYQMPDWGQPVGTQVNFDIYVDEADADGNAVPGTRQEFNFNVHGAEIDPRRDRYDMNLGRSAAWLVKLYRRTEKEPNGDEMNEFFWRQATLHCGPPPGGDGSAYGPVTLLMVRLRADQVASSAERLVRVELTRNLPWMGGNTPPQQLTNPAHAFIDIYTNQVYGGGRPLTELDTARIQNLFHFWGGDLGAYGFNAIYTQRTTVWEALSQSVQGVAAAPLPVGGLMSIVQDGIRPVRSMLFTEQNIVKASFNLTYQFEETGAPDGIEIEFVNPDTWSPAYVRWPSSSLSPDRLNLFGCSNVSQAMQFARLQWQRRQRLRRLVNFSTELEGLIPAPGERVAIAHTLPRWGVSGLVASVANLVGTLQITLDRELPWSEVTPPYYMLFRDEYAGASGVVVATQGSAANIAILSGSPWGPGQDWRTGPTQERTHFAWGDGTRVIKDFTLATLAPKGGAVVAVTGVVYDESVYAGTLPFLASPVP